MEQPILIIATLTLLSLLSYIFFWWRNNKKRAELSQSYHNEIISTIEALKASVDSQAQAIKTENTHFKESLIESHGQALKKVSEELSNILSELKTENIQFKNSLTESHEQALKKVNEELSKILNEIKSPLNVD